MTNPKGTWAETQCVNWLRDNGFPHADRIPKRGALDGGDVALCPGVIAEVKHVRQGAAGQPGRSLLTKWMAQAEIEREHSGAAFGLLIVKRSGTQDVARWFTYVRLVDLISVLEIDGPWSYIHESIPADFLVDPVCLAVGSMAALLRAAGYGHPLDWTETPNSLTEAPSRRSEALSPSFGPSLPERTS